MEDKEELFNKFVKTLSPIDFKLDNILETIHKSYIQGYDDADSNWKNNCYD